MLLDQGSLRLARQYGLDMTRLGSHGFFGEMKCSSTYVVIPRPSESTALCS